MVSEKSPDWLPAGWIMRNKVNSYGRKIKCYIDPASGCKFYSKPQVSQYLETVKGGTNTAPEIDISSVDDTVVDTNESPEWLPHGWTVEMGTRNSGKKMGSKFKIYIDPASGRKFYSKPEVSRYMRKLNSGTTPQIDTGSVNHVGATPQTGTGSVNHVGTIPQIGTTSVNHVDTTPQIGTSSVNHTLVETSESPEWLPHGWIVESKIQNSGVRGERKIKIYIDPSSGRKFYSKPEVSRYIRKLNSGTTPQIGTGSVNHVGATPQTGTGSVNHVGTIPQIGTGSVNHVDTTPQIGTGSVNDTLVETSESPEWLPHGWIVESKIQNSGVRGERKIKIYIDPKSGCKFYSKPQVSRYLEKINSGTAPQTVINAINDQSMDYSTGGGTSSLKRDASQNCKMNDSSISKEETLHGGKHSMTNVMVERVSADELPPGWIKEIRTTKVANKVRKDPYYTDPVSGYVFLSKPDALRYLKTGDISSCKVKPKKRDISDMDLMNNAISHNMDHSTGGGASLMRDVSQNCKTSQSSISKKKKSLGGEHSMKNVVVEGVSAEELPQGWVKEIRTRKIANRVVKEPYYTDPVSGYMFLSKPDALRYLKTGDINSCKIKPKKRDISDLDLVNNGISHSMDHSTRGGTSSMRDVSQNCKTNQSSISEQKKPCGGEQSMNNVVVERVSAEEFPPGWMKEIRTRKIANRVVKEPYYTDPVSGYIFRSKPDALRYLKSGDINSCKIKPKKRDASDLELMNDDDISPSSAIDGRKLSTTTRRLRFGNTCKERDDSEIHEGKESQEISELINKYFTSEEIVEVSSENGISSTVANEILQGEKLPEKGAVKHSNVKTQSSSKSRNKRKLSVPFRSSKRLAGLKPEMPVGISLNTQALQDAARDGDKIEANPLSGLTLSASAQKVPQELEVEAERETERTEDHVPADNILNIQALQDAARDGDKTEAKPLSGLTLSAPAQKVPQQLEAEAERETERTEDHMPADNSLNIQALQDAARDGGKIEANSLSGLTLSAPAQKVPQQLEVEAEREAERREDHSVPEKQQGKQEAEKDNLDKPKKELANHASLGIKTSLDVGSLNKMEKGLGEAVLEKQLEREEAEKHNDDKPESQESPRDYPFTDSWSDPCLEFAFKTLTGAIPVEENLSFQDYFQQQAETSQTQKDRCLEQPELVPPGFNLNDVASYSEATEKSVPVQQLPANPTYPSPGNGSLPSCSSTGPQQSSLEAGNNEYQTKVN